MVALLLDGLCSNRFLLVASLLADLLGHWYLGTHLLAITLVSFPAKGLVNFYRVSNFLQKIVLNGIFALIAYLLIGSIDALAHKSGISWKNLLVEIVILNPIILLMLSTVIVKLPSDIIRTE
jgi:rod shape-determining protein MreD